MFLWQYAKYQKFQDFFPVSVYVRSSFGDSFPLRLSQEFNFVSSFRNEFSFYLMFIFIADPISMFTRFSFHLQKYTEKERERENRKGNDQNSIFFNTLLHISIYCMGMG